MYNHITNKGAPAAPLLLFLLADAKYYLPTQKLIIKHLLPFVTLCISI